MEEFSNSTIKSISIQQRRYLGNKYKLLPFILDVVNSKCKNVNIVADIFSGTGVVASAFNMPGKTVITNDIMFSNYICNYAWFSPESYNPNIIMSNILTYNSLSYCGENYMTENFSNTYFSFEDCSKIGFIREDIEKKYKVGIINTREKAILIASLLYAMDRIAVTCGHYDAYRKGAAFTQRLYLQMPDAPLHNEPGNMCFQEDANELVRRISADLVYIDPPYNSRQYCDAYHLLENVALWKQPEVFGVAKKMDRTGLKSDYCTKSAPEAFENLIMNIDAPYILLSYNNMSNKGNDRSNARISDKDIFNILNSHGEVQVFSKHYRAFSAGKSDIHENEERLFLCTSRRRQYV